MDTGADDRLPMYKWRIRAIRSATGGSSPGRIVQRHRSRTGVMDREMPDLEPHLAEVVDQLHLVFPVGIREDDADYGPLLVILSGLLSERNLGVVVEAAFGLDQHVVRNQMAAALSIRKPPARQVEQLNERMVERGWYLEDDED
ncbi:hypothetical protein ACIBAG_21210 [Streptomyces sp. NPDC051243]|uniref:hypothetical protein n=1 Tax=Streptomyces sp. NPDC051243 TaxID=3365646 RepID=UPI00379BD271